MNKEKHKNKASINIIKILILLVIILAIILIVKVIKGNREEVNTANANISKSEIGVNTPNISQNEGNISQTNNVYENNVIANNIVVNETTNTNKVEENNIPENNKSTVVTGEKLGKEGLPILMYHFFYDASKGETARDGNWLEVTNFENHLKYLTENNYYFPSWEEVSEYVDGKIELPKKSVVLTVDDGDESFFKTALPVLKKYDVKMTEFLVTSWNGWYKNDYPAKQVTYQSHSNNMHQGGANGKGVMTSWSYNDILNDCKESRKVLGDEAIAFCYPFGHYTNDAKKAVKEAGFKLAFTTEAGRVKVGSDKLALPRVRTSTSTTLEVFKKLVQ